MPPTNTEHHDRLSRLEALNTDQSAELAVQTTHLSTILVQLQKLDTKIDTLSTFIDDKIPALQADIADLQRDMSTGKAWLKRVGAAVAVVIGWIGTALVKSHFGA
ncbi:MAG: hypothetical protein JWM82_3129 [Myxococcales bacterium]|nr:hypothetical protein [Myxococcales bacterium]